MYGHATNTCMVLGDSTCRATRGQLPRSDHRFLCVWPRGPSYIFLNNKCGLLVTCTFSLYYLTNNIKGRKKIATLTSIELEYRVKTINFGRGPIRERRLRGLSELFNVLRNRGTHRKSVGSRIRRLPYNFYQT